MDPEDLLLNVLEEFAYPVIRQGSLGPDEEYPEHFFTFWNNETEETGYYDNEATAQISDFDVNFYSVNPEYTYTKLKEAKKRLKESGFVIVRAGYDVGSDEKTHTGRGMNVVLRGGI